MRSVAFAASLVVAAAVLSAQSGSGRLGPGTLLVASDRLADPNFAEAVVLLIRRDEEGNLLGIVLNRPLDMMLSKVFPKLHAPDEPVFEGGPVSPDAVQALLRTSGKPPAAAEHVTQNIYLVSHKGLLEKSLKGHLSAETFRVYLGYAGWGPNQLENEVRQGAWTTAMGANYVFDSNPESLWERLNRDSQSQVARNAARQHGATMKECCFLASSLWPY